LVNAQRPQPLNRPKSPECKEVGARRPAVRARITGRRRSAFVGISRPAYLETEFALGGTNDAMSTDHRSPHDPVQEMRQHFFVPFDPDDAFATLRLAADQVPAEYAQIAAAFRQNLNAVLTTASMPFALASTGVHARHFERVGIAERIRARSIETVPADAGLSLEDFRDREAHRRARDRFQELLASTEGQEAVIQDICNFLLAGLSLGGHLKTGQSWTPQNRPVGEHPKRECSTAFERDRARPRSAPTTLTRGIPRYALDGDRASCAGARCVIGDDGAQEAVRSLWRRVRQLRGPQVRTCA